MGSREGVAPWCPIMLDECGGKLTEDGAAQETRHLVYSCRLGPNDTYTRLCLQVFDLIFIESEFYWKLRRQDCECAPGDRKSTRLNSSHLVISYAVFCLKKKKTKCNRIASYRDVVI